MRDYHHSRKEEKQEEAWQAEHQANSAVVSASLPGRAKAGGSEEIKGG